MQLREETITPERARELLGGNQGNRPLRPTTVRVYAEDMKAGRWRRTGDTIKITPDGRLIDGQHRLLAVIQADADAFWRDVIDGAGLARGDAAYMLRERLLANSRAKSRIMTVEVAALVIKAWNARRAGRDVENLRWRREGPRAEEFPAIA